MSDTQPFPPATTIRKVVITREHFEKACAFINQSTHARQSLATCGCLMNFALRDAFPEVPVIPDASATVYGDTDSSVAHACGAFTWTISSARPVMQWNFDDMTSDLIKLFDWYVANPVGHPFPVGKLPHTATLTLARPLTLDPVQR